MEEKLLESPVRYSTSSLRSTTTTRYQDPSLYENPSKRGRVSRLTGIIAGSEAGTVKSTMGGSTGTANARFKAMNPLQFTLWAHYLSIGAAMMCLCMGVFSYLWKDAETYGCKIDGDLISNKYLYTAEGECPTVFITNNKVKHICCRTNSETSLEGYPIIGAIYVFYSIFIVIYENTEWGYGLWAPNDTFFYLNRISPIGILHFLVGAAGLYNYATCLGGGCLVVAGIVYQFAAYRMEAGDGGRTERQQKQILAEEKRKKAEKKAERKSLASSPAFITPASYSLTDAMWKMLSYNPVSFSRRLYNEDKFWSYFWVSLFVAANIIIFVYTVMLWYGIVNQMQDDLKNGTLDVTCSTLICHVNRKAVRYGPVSVYAAWAKGFGVCLNFDCAILLLPIVKMLLRRIATTFPNRFAAWQRDSALFRWFFPHPVTRYVPFQHNLDLHVICSWFIFFASWGHMIAHFANLFYANEVTLRLFRFMRWDGTNYLSGAVATFSLFLILSAAPDVVRYAKYEIFIYTHHIFVIFYIAMLLHGPNFFYWTCVPVFLYLYDRYLLMNRGNTPFTVLKVEYVPPVLSLYIRPNNPGDFEFKEGQYLFLNCPYISPYQWHPFTISSAPEDLKYGPRVHIETGEEVYEVPRPADWPENTRWKKYCLVSKNWKKLDPREYLEKSETECMDYLTLHIRVHRLNDLEARSWTRKLKEYFDLLSSTNNEFSHYFISRDAHGDAQIGKQFGPDGKMPLIRVDGPHYGPSEHYCHYRTVMLVGAGIGLTPCVSILSSLIKYRWKKSFQPEILHFYWMVRYSEVDSFQWLVHMLTELSYDLKRGRQYGQIGKEYSCTMNIYITRYSAKKVAKKSLVASASDKQRLAQSDDGMDSDDTEEEEEQNPFYRPKKKYSAAMLEQCAPSFSVDDLYALMMKPTISSRDQVKIMREVAATKGDIEGSKSVPNRLQDIYVWEGRPHWDSIFQYNKETRQHKDIGVCFCGAPNIGAELTEKCEKYSGSKEQCLFVLHKENF